MSKKPSVTIGSPFRRGDFAPEYLISLSLSLLDRRYDYFIRFQEGPVIFVNRNFIAARCQSDYLLFIDSDIAWQPDDISKLVEADKDIASGIYYRGGPPFLPAFAPVSPGDLENIPANPFEILAAGCGFMLIKRRVLDAFFAQKIWPFDPLSRPVITESECWREGFPSNLYGEDYSFCDKARQLGFEVWVVPSVSLGHVLTRAYMLQPAAGEWIAAVAKMGGGF